uniref:Uncharacterized protein n=1 Tax=Lepeophtheirus salmonis TaxID=72036 RepID=A0A0K2UT28_LEPSM
MLMHNMWCVNIQTILNKNKEREKIHIYFYFIKQGVTATSRASTFHHFSGTYDDQTVQSLNLFLLFFFDKVSFFYCSFFVK